VSPASLDDHPRLQARQLRPEHRVLAVEVLQEQRPVFGELVALLVRRRDVEEPEVEAVDHRLGVQLVQRGARAPREVSDALGPRRRERPEPHGIEGAGHVVGAPDRHDVGERRASVGVTRPVPDPHRVAGPGAARCPLVCERHAREALALVDGPIRSERAIHHELDRLVDRFEAEPRDERPHGLRPGGERLAHDDDVAARLRRDEVGRCGQGASVVVVPVGVVEGDRLLGAGELHLAGTDLEGDLRDRGDPEGLRARLPDQRGGG
jgi:hypothetical protein